MVQTLCSQAFSHNGDPCVTPDKISQTVLFPDLFDKPLVATFKREQASSDGGAVLLKAAERVYGLVKAFAGCLADKRAPEKIRHTLAELIGQRIFGIACGHPDGNDADHLAEDPIHKLLLGRDPVAGAPLAWQPTIAGHASPKTTKLYDRTADTVTVDEILRFAALQLGADAETIHAYARRQQTVSAHQRRIGQYLRLRTFDTAAGEQLARFLEDEALRLDRTASLLARARGWFRDEHVLAPADSALRRAVGGARQKVRALLTQRIAERLSAAMRDRLDALVDVGDDDPHSPLHRIKTGSSNPSVGGMKRLLARLELIEATGVLEIDMGWVNGNYQRILFHSVRTVSADRVARWLPRAGTSHWCASCTRRGGTRSTRPSTCTASSSTATASWSKPASTTCSRRNARPSTGSFTATASSARCCSIPTSATTS